MAMAMARAVIGPSSTSALFRNETPCRTSCCTPQLSSRLQFSPLSPPLIRRSVHALSITATEFRLSRSGLGSFTSWQGRSHLGDVVRILAGRHWQSRRGIARKVHASLFGVGAPEALVVAVVALVVFGPKGLAEVARTLGKSLKAFQPTIQELQQVSREFRTTLEQEIGLDELRNPKPLDKPPPYQQQQPLTQQPPRRENGAPDGKAYTAEDYVRVTEEQAKALVPEELRRQAEAAAWGSSPPPPKTPADNESKEPIIEQRKPQDES